MEAVGKILPFICSMHMRDGEPRVVEILTPLWPLAVGKGIAQHSRPITFVSGTLTLATACACWAVQLRQMSEELRAGINSFLQRPVVRKLRVRHMPNLALEDGNTKSETGNWRTGNWELETGKSKLATGSMPALKVASLADSVLDVEDAPAKSFTRAGTRKSENRERRRRTRVRKR